MLGRDVDVGMGDKNQNIKFACDMFKRWQKLRGCCWPTKGRWDSWLPKEKNSIGPETIKRLSQACENFTRPTPMPTIYILG